MGFTVKLASPDGSNWEDEFSEENSEYWIGPGGTLVAFGKSFDKECQWRTYAPGQWLEVRANTGPSVINE
ncbi:hypothetical protein [Mycobacteroides abscessus]|uniref:Uncharacterized protein n=1 Tax=Mycobacteroides abscessus TaxID=36809 RepID=A0A0U0ZRQ7_9MYCO|nr:hypothetical protein [Mycobacteroides abscessus]MBL3735075.1 hypothetical protein [Mycobacteroides abscessus subsp. massiliense]MBL3746432.1 hypothetical protein [Mycobacteroides abscessus subsp. massiliense]MBL3758679.1 hypothetical protein [Mycobacteroides abscessus subsp. massiliense]MBN7483542.1 hypothetical protein [Mycobacteroides abscessus subsp. massiliense]MDM2105915.1 hypothetical protein [Mycobacteroides abscessus]